MSGRFTFASGNTLTAAQLNTNVMDGIPFKMIAGSSTGVVASQAITFPASFTTGVTPIVVATVGSNATSTTSATISGASATGFTVYLWSGAVANAVSRGITYLAFQMTSTTGTGNS